MQHAPAGVNPPPFASQTAFATFPAFRQRVHTRSLLTAPPTMPRSETRLGIHRRFVMLWAWLTLWPTEGPLPQISHRWAMLTPRGERWSAEDGSLYSMM